MKVFNDYAKSFDERGQLPKYVPPFIYKSADHLGVCPICKFHKVGPKKVCLLMGVVFKEKSRATPGSRDKLAASRRNPRFLFN